MAIVHCFIALVTLTPQVPHLIGTLHAGKWLALLALGQIAGVDMTTLPVPSVPSVLTDVPIASFTLPDCVL